MKYKNMALVLGLMLGMNTIMGSYAAASDSAMSVQEETQDAHNTGGEMGEPPAKPQGEGAEMGEPPAKPDGNDESGEQPAKPEGEEPPAKPDGEDGEMGEPPAMPEGGQPQGGPGGPGQSGGVEEYAAVTEYTEDGDYTGETYASSGTDENAVHILNGASVTLNNVEITRESSDSTGGDNSSFYGVGAALLATDGTAYVSGSTVTTDAAGGAGLFAYGDGTVYAADTVINTQQDTSGGIHAAGGGTLYAWDLDVTTQGESAAAIRSDRGGGTMVVDGGTYTSNGTGSPAVYCTADIAIHDAQLTANGSEAICIEGLNSLHLYDTDLTGNMSDLEQNDCTWNVILYQSMSGDSEVGNSTFSMEGGTLKAENGGMFYTTNTESTFILKDVEIENAQDSEFFLKCTGNANQRGWGQSGSNGADSNFTAISQTMEGDVIWDSISTLDFYVTQGSSLTGAVINDESCAGEGGDGYCNLYLSEDSVWTVTGDSVLSTLHNAGTIIDADGNAVTIQGADGTVYVQGDSAYTVTVSVYEESADLSGAAAESVWSDYEMERPENL